MTHSGDGNVTLSKWETDKQKIYFQAWRFSILHKNLNSFLYNVSVEDVEYGKKQLWRHGVKVRELPCPVFNDILLWGKVESKTSRSSHVGCLSLAKNKTVVIVTCNSQSNQQFMMISDYTIRPYGTDDCITTFDGAEETYVQPCDQSASKWGINDPTQQLIDLKYKNCLTATERKTVQLRRCNVNNNQTWKFGQVNEQTNKKPLYLADIIMYLT